MHLSPVLSPSGEPIFSAGGEDAWKVEEYRGFVVSLEWVGGNSRTPQPCMVIWPASNVFVAGSTPGMWTIGRRAITEFVGFTKDNKCTGSASIHCYRECYEALPMLGKDRNDKQAFLALVDTIIKFAPELVHMPVAPKHVKKKLAGDPTWEFTHTDQSTGKTVKEATI